MTHPDGPAGLNRDTIERWADEACTHDLMSDEHFRIVARENGGQG